jgi:hypothetical protein
MQINHSVNRPTITKTVKNLSFIKIFGIVFKCSPQKFTEMRYNVRSCRCRNIPRVEEVRETGVTFDVYL